MPPEAGERSAADVGVPAALEAEQVSAQADIDALRATMASLQRDRSISSDDDEHDPDGAPLSGEWSRIRGLLQAAQTRLGEADAALGRLHSGRYGLCLSCGEPIAAARLEVRPTAALCVSCAARSER